MDQRSLYDHPVEWIAQCERSFSTQLERIIKEILERIDLKIIRLTGPTCSGKTTVANLLIQRLKEKGRTVHLVSIDDFYYDKEILHQKSTERGDGSVDYDSVHTIDLNALGQFVRDFSQGNQCECPIFDFCEGKRIGVRPITCQKDDIFIFEGIQVLYPEVSSLLENTPSVGVYIVPESSIEIGNQLFYPNEIRLLRRLVRDYNFRNTMPEVTFSMWESVRRNEEINIFPYADHCSLHIDATMPYEIGILKPYLIQILPTVPSNSVHYQKAQDILKQLKDVIPISNQLLPKDSLYREFV